MKKLLFLLLLSSPFAAQAQWDLNLAHIHESIEDGEFSLISIHLGLDGWEVGETELREDGYYYTHFSHPKAVADCDTCPSSHIVVSWGLRKGDGLRYPVGFEVYPKGEDKQSLKQLIDSTGFKYTVSMITNDPRDESSTTLYAYNWDEGTGGALWELIEMPGSHPKAWFRFASEEGITEAIELDFELLDELLLLE